MKAIIAPGKTPVGGCPQQAEPWGCSPIAGYPIITVYVVVGPITRHPKVTVNRAGRLYINR
jgi:hypothetical protein